MRTAVQHTREIEEMTLNNEIDPILIRKFEHGSTYDPFDFSMTKYKMERAQYFNAPKYDLFNMSGQDPLEFWKV